MLRKLSGLLRFIGFPNMNCEETVLHKPNGFSYLHFALNFLFFVHCVAKINRRKHLSTDQVLYCFRGFHYFLTFQIVSKSGISI